MHSAKPGLALVISVQGVPKKSDKIGLKFKSIKEARRSDFAKDSARFSGF